jgi:hypothetical protein
MKKIKVLVGHPGKQHSLKLAEAILNDSKYDLIYATTVYDKKNSFFMRFVKAILSSKNNERANARKSELLEDSQVITFCSILGLFRIFLAHYDKSQKYFQKMTCYLGDVFGMKMAKYAIKNDIDIIITYDTFSQKCYEYIDHYAKKRIIKVMDASAANLSYQKKIFEKDMKCSPEFAEKLKQEISFTLNDERQNYYIDEAKRADYIIAASEFSKKSYVAVGVPQKNVFVCPYGMDSLNYEEKHIGKTDELVFTFMGGTRQAKGLSYVLEAFTRLSNKDTKLNIVGKDNLVQDIKKKYRGNIKYWGQQLHSKIPEILSETDILLFPSLSDGFGFAAAEGMAAGCPVIASENSGIADLIEDGINGYVIPIQSTEALYEKMLWFVDNREKIQTMSDNAVRTIKKMTWEQYNQKILDILKYLT